MLTRYSKGKYNYVYRDIINDNDYSNDITYAYDDEYDDDDDNNNNQD